MVCLTDIKNDLLSMKVEDFYLKHIVKSYNWYFKEYLKVSSDEILDRLDCFKEIISKNFGISFHSSQLVGSAKLGYSLSPTKCLKPFENETSDIDIALVSDKLYSFYWEKLRERKAFKIYSKYFYQQLTNSVFRGYIDEKFLSGIDDIRTVWQDMKAPTNKSLQDKLSVIHPINYRIYRSWEDLEEYQLSGIIATCRAIKEQKGV